VHVHFEAHEPVSDCVVGFAFYNMDGVHMAESNTRFTGLPLPDPDGIGRLDCCLDRFPLMPGHYLLGPSIHDYNLLHCYDLRYMPFPLQVEPGEGPEIWGFVEFGGEWSVHSADANARHEGFGSEPTSNEERSESPASVDRRQDLQAE
jgi:hypothetical protein